MPIEAGGGKELLLGLFKRFVFEIQDTEYGR